MRPLTPENVASTRRTGRWWPIALILVGVYLMAAVPLILSAGARGRPGEDQINYHQPAVHTFAQQLPRPDVSDYLSATTPGYHLVLAVVERFVSTDVRVLQLTAACFTVVLLAALARTVFLFLQGGREVSFAGRWAGWGEALVLCLPFTCSLYVLEAGVWMLPDNAGWLLVLACVGLAFSEPFGRRTIVLGGLLLIGVALVRQVHLWVAGSLWAAAWLAPGVQPPGGMSAILTKPVERLRSLAPMLAATAPALMVLAYFVVTWGGLTPPSFQGQYAGVDFASYAFVLSLVGLGSLPFVFYLVDALIDLTKTRRSHIAMVMGAGAVAAVLPNTTFGVDKGNFSGIWGLTRELPTIAGHTSPVIVALSSFGAFMLLAWWRALSLRDRWIMLGTWFGFATAQAMSYQLWQRYHEPMVLMMLAIMAARSRGTGARSVLTDRLIAPLRLGAVAAFALVLGVVTAARLSSYGPAKIYDIEHINRLAKPSEP